MEFDVCYRALGTRDPRFDGWFFTAVSSTGIYCRPSCPANTPKREHVRFFPSAAACQQAGFRACKRCRPDATPGSPEWNSRGDVVARAMRLIADGVIDREGVPGLAAALGYSVRQLQRVVAAELGAGPLALARAQRAQAARTLIETSALPMTDVAFAAGFESIRQFNATVRAVFAMTPTELRRRAARSPGAGGPGATRPTPAGTGLRLKLAFRRPFCPENLFGHLAATAVPGVEEVRGSTYRRTVRLPFGPGIVELIPETAHVGCRLRLADLRDLSAAIARCRWLLDLDADPEAIDGQLAEDPRLAPLVARAPGRRVPRTVDGPEMAIRAVLGQQISTAAARTHAARLAARYGDPVSDPEGSLTRVFPDPAALSEFELAMPAGRRATVHALLGALRAGELDLTPGGDRERARAGLESLPGIGPWTAEVVAMRALGDPDAFPLTDLGVRRGAEALGLPGARSDLLACAERWRPWRAYAVQHLWGATRHPINQWPPVAAGASERGPARLAA
ncbi:MAG: DNA-3-methyladenine glycosylase 2 family protein [Solirubrobacterales bacterium]|nr:DNA-3-methyladenine glycosylase 2 family protein [Solirubrobacterales bacterium]